MSCSRRKTKHQLDCFDKAGHVTPMSFLSRLSGMRLYHHIRRKSAKAVCGCCNDGRLGTHSKGRCLKSRAPMTGCSLPEGHHNRRAADISAADAYRLHLSLLQANSKGFFEMGSSHAVLLHICCGLLLLTPGSLASLQGRGLSSQAIQSHQRQAIPILMDVLAASLPCL